MMSEKKKGLVLEYGEDGAITVLTAGGEFISVPWPAADRPGIGHEVEFTPPKAVKFPTAMKYLRSRAFIAVAACLLLFLLSIPMWSGLFFLHPEQVVAYVNVDINPSLELGLNHQGTVVQVTSLNDDGRLLLEKMAQQNLSLQNMPADEAVRLITTAAIQEQYITAEKENAVVITISKTKQGIKPAKVIADVQNLTNEVKKVLADNKVAGQTEQLEVPVEIHDKAKSLGVSPGKYVILLEAAEEGLPLSLDDIKGESIIKAVKEAGGVPGRLISKAQQDKNRLKELEKRFAARQKELEKRPTFYPFERDGEKNREDGKPAQQDRDRDRDRGREGEEDTGREQQKDNRRSGSSDFDGHTKGRSADNDDQEKDRDNKDIDDKDQEDKDDNKKIGNAKKNNESRRRQNIRDQVEDMLSKLKTRFTNNRNGNNRGYHNGWQFNSRGGWADDNEKGGSFGNSSGTKN